MSLKKIIVLMVPLFTITSTPFSDPVFLTDWNWTDINGILHEYEAYSFSSQSWETSNSFVANEWHLATITGDEEQKALICGLNGFTGEYWLGGSQTAQNTNPEDDWEWVTGEKWDYKNWAPGEPNDAHGSSSEQHVAVWSNWGTTNWLWNDEGYLPNISGYIVEKSQAVPEPTMLSLLPISLLALSGLVRKKQ